MKTWWKAVCLTAAVAGTLMVAGCGGGADETKSLADCKAEAAKMDNAKLRDTATAYKKAIEAKQGEVKALAEKLKAIPLTEITGDKAKALKADADKLNGSLKALTERFKVYYDQLKEKGGDVSGLDI